MTNSVLSIGQCATLACLMEATAAKPGNVHRGADFEDLTYFDFVASAMAIGPAFEEASGGRKPFGTLSSNGLGDLVYSAVIATRQAVCTNTNLGTILLLAPLALASPGETLSAGISRVLSKLTADDCRDVYAAIRLAHPGGMGKVEEDDIAEAPPVDLLAAMRLAADRDLVARQYVNSFAEVFDEVVPGIEAGLARGWSLSDTIIRVHVQLMHDHPDSLIARKCGPEIAQQSAAFAGQTLAAGLPGEEAYTEALADLDFWLRADHHHRNPGTTADLVAAGLFVALREGIIKAPYKFYG